MRIYSKPKINQLKEKLFQQYLFTNLAKFEHINKTHTLSAEEFLNPFLDIRKIESLLKTEKFLSINKKESLLKVLSQLPDNIRVAKNNKFVSIDFLIIDSQQDKKQYIEFHEKQHRDLTVNRLTPVFDNQFNRFEIPRFAQRILKDIWRFENLPNYKIVWFDWFAANSTYKIESLLTSKKNEFEMEGRFSFTKLMQKTSFESNGVV